MIIPIVPFITHVTARDLMIEQMQPVGSINPHVFEVVAEHITDMRLIKNIRNEFIVFKEKLRSHFQHQLAGVTQESLFALLAYKNIHLTDFELIKTGHSQLDSLYRAGRDLVEANISHINHQMQQAETALAHGTDFGAHAAELGDRLNAYLLRLLRHHGQPGLRGQCSVFVDGGFHATENFNNPSAGFSELRSEQFWTTLLDISPSKTVHVQTAAGIALSITFEDMEVALGQSLSIGTWTMQNRVRGDARITQLERDRDFLRQATLAQLVERQDLRSDPDNARSMNMEELMQHILTSDLARQLVRTGYINWNFAVYVGDYYGKYVSATAMNFIVHHVRRNEVGLSVHLYPNDVEAILWEHPEMLSERSAYNISIIEHLSSRPPTDHQFGTFLQSLMKWGPGEQWFLAEYLSGYQHYRGALIRGLSRIWPKTLVILSELDLTEDRKLSALNEALSAADPAVGYEVNDWVRNIVRDNFSELPIFCSDRYLISAARICDMLEYLDVQLPTLEHLTEDLRAEVIRRRLHITTPRNIVAPQPRSGMLPVELDHC